MVKTVQECHEVVVCGGGLAGICAAVAAARHGARTCLIQDRPVFGGNSSSEIRVPPLGGGYRHAYGRETGIISELLIEERARNHRCIFSGCRGNSIWDIVLYDLAVRTANLTCHLNTTVEVVEMAGSRRIEAVAGRVANAEVRLEVAGDLFIDCTGDGVVAALACCGWRIGSEGRDEFGEPHAPARASDDVMGHSLLFNTIDMGYPVPFTPPEWAVAYEDASFFYEQGRVPGDLHGGYWWIEICIPWHPIHDNEAIRHELTRHLLGVWDWIKNRDPNLRERAANLAIDWIGQVPGKRESRRVMGRYLMTEHDVVGNTVFEDEVAFGAWHIDLHTPGGLLASTSNPAAAEGYAPGAAYTKSIHVAPYEIPLRVLIARDVDNLMMAGRDVSVTRAALATMRVQGTTALMGQAAGTAAAVALRHDIPVYEVPHRAISELQQKLLRDGCFLLHARNQDPADLACSAVASASSEARCEGVDPPDWNNLGEGDSPEWMEAVGNGPGIAGRRETELLEHRRAQWIAVGIDRIDALAVCLSNLTEEPQGVEALLLPADHIWDYRVDSGEPLARTMLQVPPGRFHWVEWKLNVDVPSGRYLRLDLLPNPRVEWHTGRMMQPGHPSAFQVSPDKMRRYGLGLTLAFRVTPPQPCFGASNVLTGVTRPYCWTNLWRSDPDETTEPWLQLEWPTLQTVGQVELTFAGYMVGAYQSYPPFYRDPQCARDYRIEAWADGYWRPVADITGNYQRHRRHTLDQPVTTDRLRVVIRATHSDPSAGIYEMRCYGPV
jgi:hypothetical protein